MVRKGPVDVVTWTPAEAPAGCLDGGESSDNCELLAVGEGRKWRYRIVVSPQPGSFSQTS